MSVTVGAFVSLSIHLSPKQSIDRLVDSYRAYAAFGNDKSLQLYRFTFTP